MNKKEKERVVIIIFTGKKEEGWLCFSCRTRWRRKEQDKWLSRGGGQRRRCLGADDDTLATGGLLLVHVLVLGGAFG